MPSGKKTAPEVVLMARIRLRPGAGEAFRHRVEEGLAAAAKRPRFVRAAVHENRTLPGHLVVCETWRGTPERFLREEMSRPYRRRYEAAIAELAMEREIDWLTPASEWTG
jgi:quinol monooxygenase YgiN